ncbi:hypothetical protein MMC20_001022 [Loxospora ochrophaea]|nr:hypothetical protein [Loxospora ochrophaea]
MTITPSFPPIGPRRANWPQTQALNPPAQAPRSAFYDAARSNTYLCFCLPDEPVWRNQFPRSFSRPRGGMQLPIRNWDLVMGSSALGWAGEETNWPLQPPIRPPREGNDLYGLESWVNRPRRAPRTPPGLTRPQVAAGPSRDGAASRASAPNASTSTARTLWSETRLWFETRHTQWTSSTLSTASTERPSLPSPVPSSTRPFSPPPIPPTAAGDFYRRRRPYPWEVDSANRDRRAETREGALYFNDAYYYEQVMQPSTAPTFTCVVAVSRLPWADMTQNMRWVCVWEDLAGPRGRWIWVRSDWWKAVVRY